ncbi:MAG TPA: glycerol-3-phosphate acyltransferase [Acidimicrobiales bacterium]|nr:glycerol-3-phosphate acyltransferase [Acidimicrobiales bacterium]
MDAVGALVVAYLLGTIPTAVIVSHLASGGQVDIRQAGSGNPGALNTLGVHGAKWGAVVLVFDMGKAALACLIGLQVSDAVGCYAGSAAVIGHCFPVWFRFRGGKGIASAAGQCLVTFPVFSPIAVAVTVLSSRRRFAARAFLAGVFTAGVWIAAAVLWAAADLSNGWGVEPGAALVGSAVISGAVILYKFTSATTAPPPPVPEAS